MARRRPITQQPRIIEIDYYHAIDRVASAWNTAALKYAGMLPDGQERMDGYFENTMAAFLRAMARDVNDEFVKINFAKFFANTSLFSWRNWRTQIDAAMAGSPLSRNPAGTRFPKWAQGMAFNNEGKWTLPATQPYNEPGMARLLDRWTKSNSELIVNFNAQRDRQLTDKVFEAVRSGRSRRQLIDDIMPNVEALNQMGGIVNGMTADQRADLIATDQILTANSQLTDQRMVNAGVAYYIWRGMDDGRERPAHVRLNDMVFRVDGLPMTDADLRAVGRTGQLYRHPTEADATASSPGKPIRCRCYAEALFPGADYDEDEDE